MIDNNIKPLKLQPPPKPILLCGKEDLRLPDEFFNELEDWDDVVELPFSVHAYQPKKAINSNSERVR